MRLTIDIKKLISANGRAIRQLVGLLTLYSLAKRFDIPLNVEIVSKDTMTPKNATSIGAERVMNAIYVNASNAVRGHDKVEIAKTLYAYAKRRNTNAGTVDYAAKLLAKIADQCIFVTDKERILSLLSEL